MSRRRHDRSAATVVIAATLASVLWCGFNLAGLRMDLFYTEGWYYFLTDDQQQSVYHCMLRRIAMVAVPLVATNVASVLLLWAAFRRREAA